MSYMLHSAYNMKLTPELKSFTLFARCKYSGNSAKYRSLCVNFAYFALDCLKFKVKDSHYHYRHICFKNLI